MKKGIIYIMTSAVSGLIKIGQTNTESYKNRMRTLENNGYYNVVGLKQLFAIEVEDYEKKEKLLHEVFNKHRVGVSELFALDYEIIQQLLLSFEGKVMFPAELNNKEKEEVFEASVKLRTQGEKFSFYKKGLKDGDIIRFSKDSSKVATVVSERGVEFGGQIWKLSPLTRHLFSQANNLTKSGAYQGAAYFEFKGTILTKLSDQVVTKTPDYQF
ncbi:MAG: GIY-YIG nuclease family protein [Candidatus Parcubacteria bacterium]|nr:GIY-YIG nuclease family protein [Candidatus Paceibacterota bacterium]